MKALLELGPSECRYALNEGDPEYLFCGKPTCFQHNGGIMRASSYCREHHLVCTEPARTRVKA